jgi:S-DNA-T family DNA segregation ATPase FtsK/SpoIIIE
LPKSSTPPDDRLRRELYGVGLVTLGLIMFASLALNAQGYTGYLPAGISQALRVLVGSGAYVVALLCLAMGLAAVLGEGRALNVRLLASVGLFFACFLLSLHVGVPRGAEFDGEALAHGGGIVGASLWWVSRHVLGPVCTWIVVAGVLLVAAILFTQGHSAAGRAAIMEAVRSWAGRLWTEARAGAAERRKQRKSQPQRLKATETQTPATPARQPVLELSLEADESVPPPDVADETTSAATEAQDTPPTTRSRAGSKQRAGKPKKPARSGADKPYQPPPVSLLSKLSTDVETKEERNQAEANIALLEDTLEAFGIQAKVRHYVRGPSVTRYEVEPVRGIRVSRIARLADDLALAFGAIDVRVEAPIPGKSLIGIEVPNQEVAIVGLRSILESEAYAASPSLLAVGIGKDIAGAPVIADLGRMPHLLIAGATNSGKTVCLHSIITSLLVRARPEEVRLILIDPKRVELMLYDGIPHLLAPVVQTAPQAADVLRKTIREMERRYDMFATKGVVNLAEYNELADMEKEDEEDEFQRLPYVVLLIDELADLMMQAKAEFEYSICRLAQLARATGIHLVIATQRPSVNVVTGTIKANISSRIALTVASVHDSRTIIDGQGADRLIGCGDMLYLPFDENKPRRVQGAYVKRADLEKMVDHLRQQGEPQYEIIPEVKDELGSYADEADPSDELFDAAVELVVGNQEASVSMLQRRFKVGYARAGRLIDMMEERGIVGPSEGSKPRKVLVGPGYTWGELEPGLFEEESAEDAGEAATDRAASTEEKVAVTGDGEQE